MPNKTEKDEKVQFDLSNDNLIKTLKKHLRDWAQDHPTEKFITPKDFQNQFAQFDKFESASFRRGFYKAKSRFEAGENGS